MKYYSDTYSGNNSLLTIHSVEKIKADIYSDTIQIKLSFTMDRLEENLEAENSLFGFRINFVDESEYTTFRTDERKFDYVYSTPPRTITRNINITINDKITLDYLPENFSAQNGFFSQNISYVKNENVLEMKNVYERFVTHIPSENYEMLYQFFESVYEAEHEYITYIK